MIKCVEWDVSSMKDPQIEPSAQKHLFDGITRNNRLGKKNTYFGLVKTLRNAQNVLLSMHCLLLFLLKGSETGSGFLKLSKRLEALFLIKRCCCGLSRTSHKKWVICTVVAFFRPWMSSNAGYFRCLPLKTIIRGLFAVFGVLMCMRWFVMRLPLKSHKVNSLPTKHLVSETKIAFRWTDVFHGYASIWLFKNQGLTHSHPLGRIWSSDRPWHMTA